MKKSIFIILLLSFSFFLFNDIQIVYCAGYGEENDNLGQFVDDYENTNNITVLSNVFRNTTLNAIQLNATTSPLSYGDFSNGFEIVIDCDWIDENLTDFPIFLNISDVVGLGNDDVTPIFDVIGDSYQKIAITNQAQDIEYYVDVEYWDSTEELGYLWTSLNVSSLENVTIRFFFDSTITNNTSYVDISGSIPAQNVWNNEFIGVWHLREATEPFLDSTLYNNDLYSIGTVTLGTYFIDGGQDIVGVDDGFTVSMSIAYDDLTIESWIDYDVLDSDRCVASVWYVGGNSQGFVFYYDIEPNNRMRFLVDDDSTNGGVAQAYFGDTPPIINSFYYYVGKRVRNDFVYGYQNAVETQGSATSDVVIPDGGVNITIGHDNLNRDFDGQMDELRISNVSRSKHWINSTYLTEQDALVDWITYSLSGYETDGYFITEDYLNYTTGNSLILLTNTTIPSGTTLTAQFSNDNATWVDNEGNVGNTPLIDGFYSVDLRGLNYTDLYSIFNFTGLTETPIFYQSRLITTNGTTGVTEETYYSWNILTIFGGIFVFFILNANMVWKRR